MEPVVQGSGRKDQPCMQESQTSVIPIYAGNGQISFCISKYSSGLNGINLKLP